MLSTIQKSLVNKIKSLTTIKRAEINSISINETTDEIVALDLGIEFITEFNLGKVLSVISELSDITDSDDISINQFTGKGILIR